MHFALFLINGASLGEGGNTEGSLLVHLDLGNYVLYYKEGAINLTSSEFMIRYFDNIMRLRNEELSPTAAAVVASPSVPRSVLFPSLYYQKCPLIYLGNL